MGHGKRWLLAACVLAIAGGCFLKPRGAREAGRYYNAKQGFSIKFPGDWEVRENVIGGATVAGLSPQTGPDDTFRENVVVLVENLAKTMTLEEYFAANLSTMRTLLTDLEEQEQGEVVLNGQPARFLNYSTRMGTVKTRLLLYVLVKGRRGYGITCTAAPDQFENYRAVFEETMQTFRLEQ